MATQELTLPGKLVKKANALTRAKLNNSLSTVVGSRIVAGLIACIRADDTDFQDVYRVSIKDFIADDAGGYNYAKAKEICRNLLDAKAEVEESDAKGKRIYRGYPVFTSIEYVEGEAFVSATFNACMRGFLLNLKGHFTELNLLEYLRLPSIYSQRIFEILKSWSSEQEITIPLTDLHRMLNTPPSLKIYRDFKKRVLTQAHKDIIQKTDLRYEWEAIKTGRAITAIRFIFAKKQKRKAIAAKVMETDPEPRNQNILAALDCAKGKNGSCSEQDNDQAICAICPQTRFKRRL